MFKFPTSRLFSTLKSALRPAMPRFKVSATWLLTLAWIFLLVWIWWQGPKWTLYEQHWLAPLANRWLATAVWGLIALVWLTWRVMKRLQKLEKQQKQQREEEKDPLTVELHRQQQYLDHWLGGARRAPEHSPATPARPRAPQPDAPPLSVAVAVVYGHWSCG